MLRLYIGNKSYSSWSLRAWLALEHTGQPFEEVVIPLSGPGVATPGIRERSPSGRVPALEHDGLIVWDSMAIGEYLAELFPRAALWPEDRVARAIARAACAEMHSGFPSLRNQLPMNVRRAPTVVTPNADTAQEIARIVELWSDCRRRFGAGGPFLFGRFSLADAMYAPVAARFRTYGVPVEGEARAYVETTHAMPAMRTWIDAAKKEPWFIEGYERIGA
jgi:glutathione S-transferase